MTNSHILNIPYGQQVLNIHLPGSRIPDLVRYREETVKPSTQSILEALRQPIGTPGLKELARGRNQAIVLISDSSRLSPSSVFLPHLLRELNDAGLKDEQITVIVALGMHRKQTEEELQQLVGPDLYRRIKVLNHSALPEDCVRVGRTRQGTPIEINRRVVEADLRIATGNVEPHRLVGISGGVKALIPGVASQACIERNHSLSQIFKVSEGDPDNPIHADLEEALKAVPIDFLFNVIVNHRKEIIAAAAGDVVDAHRKLLETARKLFLVPVAKAYDAVIVSPGGYPKDLQLYQAVKSLVNASRLLKPGAPILMAAECGEHFGNGVFQYWTETIQDLKLVEAKLQKQFVLGAHKLGHIAEVLKEHSVSLYSAVPAPLVRLLGFRPVGDLRQAAIELLEGRYGEVAFMPYGALTFPVLSGHSGSAR
jgi:nickel-dependent lactate racemase